MEDESVKNSLKLYWEDQRKNAKKPFFSPLKMIKHNESYAKDKNTPAVSKSK